MEAGRLESGRFALNNERVGMLYGNHIDLAAEAIGNKARELLVSLYTFAGANIYTASLS